MRDDKWGCDVLAGGRAVSAVAMGDVPVTRRRGGIGGAAGSTSTAEAAVTMSAAGSGRATCGGDSVSRCSGAVWRAASPLSLTAALLLPSTRPTLRSFVLPARTRCMSSAQRSAICTASSVRDLSLGSSRSTSAFSAARAARPTVADAMPSSFSTAAAKASASLCTSSCDSASCSIDASASANPVPSPASSLSQSHFFRGDNDDDGAVVAGECGGSGSSALSDLPRVDRVGRWIRRTAGVVASNRRSGFVGDASVAAVRFPRCSGTRSAGLCGGSGGGEKIRSAASRPAAAADAWLGEALRSRRRESFPFVGRGRSDAEGSVPAANPAR